MSSIHTRLSMNTREYRILEYSWDIREYYVINTRANASIGLAALANIRIREYILVQLSSADDGVRLHYPTTELSRVKRGWVHHYNMLAHFCQNKVRAATYQSS